MWFRGIKLSVLVGVKSEEIEILVNHLKKLLHFCSELVDYTQSYLQTDKFGLHFGLEYNFQLDYNLW